MINLKSFEDYVVKYAKETLKIHNRLNEGIENESNIYGSVLNISNKVCLVINDYILALEMMENDNEVYCLYYDNSMKYTKDLPHNFQFVDLSKNIEDIRKQISNIFDKIWKLRKDLVFDYIINVPPQTQKGLEYKLIANVNSFIFCYPFLKLNGNKSTKDERGERVIIYRRGKSIYYSFDESNVMDEFDRLIYDCRGINFKRGRKVSSSEWSKFDSKDKSIRYLVAVFSEDEEDDVINNRNQESIDQDENDYSWDPNVGRDDDHPFVGMSEPKIYAFSSKEVNNVLKGRGDGDSIKVGDTNRTVSRRLSEWREKFPDLVRIKSWDAVLNGCGEGIDGKIFRDYTIHKLLTQEVNDEYHKEGKKISRVNINEFPDDFIEKNRYSNEFFRNCTKEDVDHAIEILKDRCRDNRSKFLYDLKDNTDNDDDAILPSHDKHGGFIDRNIQKDTIDGFVKALKRGKKKMLMYAVMRFGKTYVACRCAQQMPNNRFTVIVTAKPGVRNEWTGTVNPNDEFDGYDMYDATDKKGGLSEMLNKWAETKKDADGNPEEATLERYFSYPENKDKHIMLFSSLQDLFGNTKNKNKITLKPDVKEKHKCFNKFPVDLLIIDECHYGTQTSNFGGVIGEKENPKLKEYMKTLNLKNAIKLYLSGTPYDLLLDNKFYDDEIISTVGFMGIINAKNKWDKDHKSAIEEGKEHWEDNPYFGTPEMLEFGYNIEDFKLSEYSEDYNTTFEQLFLCHKIDNNGNVVEKDKPGKWEFIHKQDVEDIFEILDGSKNSEGLVSFLDVPEIKKGNMCKHIVITLPNTNCCDALEDLFVEKRNNFNNFGEYKIIKASTADGEIDTEKVKKLIDSHVKAGNKTITLTCDRLLTGVTIKPWDTMFFMKDCSSPQEYDQAKFRIMTPYVKNVKSIDIDENGNPKKGDTTKINMKPQVLFVDFLQNRIVEMKERRYDAEFCAEGKDDYSKSEFEKKVEEEKGSITLLLLKDGKFVTGSSADVGKMVLEIRDKRAVEMTMDQVFNECDRVSDPTDDEIDYMLTHKIKRTGNEKNPKTTIELRKHLESIKTPGSSDLEKTTPDEKKLSKIERMKKLKEEHPDVYKKCVKICKEGRKTIIKDILMYILLKNRGNRSYAGKSENELIKDFKERYDEYLRDENKDSYNFVDWMSEFHPDEYNKEDVNVSTIDKFSDLRDSFNHFHKFDRPKVKDTPAELIPSQMKENDKIICGIFCEDMGIKEPDYSDPHKVSETVEEILDTISMWWDIICHNRHDKHIILQSWSNMQLKYKKLEMEGKNDFESLRGVLSKYSRLGKTEIVTPAEMCPKLFENVVIFNKKSKPKILDCYGGKIGEVFNELWNNEAFSDLSKEDKLNSYYMICRTRSIAELNFFAIKSYMKGGKGVKGFGTHELKRKWFNEHILIYDPNPTSGILGISTLDENDPSNEGLTREEILKKNSDLYDRIKNKYENEGTELSFNSYLDQSEFDYIFVYGDNNETDDSYEPVEEKIEFDRLETFSEFMKLLVEGKLSDEEKEKKEKEKELKKWGLPELKTKIENTFKDKEGKPVMKFDVIVGNPPYGVRKKGSSDTLHLQIMKTVLDFCKSKLCFVMPSSPIKKQLDKNGTWYKMFQTSVCTNIETVDKSVFPNTIQDDVAIYYCDRDADPDEYDRQLDVDDKIYDLLPECGKLFVDKMTSNQLKIWKPYLQDKSLKDKDLKFIYDNIKDECYYLNVNRAGVKPRDKGETQWLSGELQKIDILSKDEELVFCEKQTGCVNIIQCPNKEYGENLKNLMVNGKVLRYSLWIMQTDQHIYKKCFKYVPSLHYENIHNDSELLAKCGFTDDEITKVLNYLKDFNFSQNRNEIVRGTNKVKEVSKSNLIPSESDFKQMKEDSKKLEPDEFNKKYKDYYEEYKNEYDKQVETDNEGGEVHKEIFKYWIVNKFDEMMKDEEPVEN